VRIKFGGQMLRFGEASRLKTRFVTLSEPGALVCAT